MKEKWNLSYYLEKELAKTYVPCDVFVRSEKEVGIRKEVIGSVIKSAMKTGIRIR